MKGAMEAGNTLLVDEPLMLNRSVERKQNGVVVSYAMRTEGEHAIAVRIRDVLPKRIEGRDKGFHSEYGPRDWELTDEALVFEDVVSADEDVFVKFGILSSGGIDIGVEPPDPVVESMQPIDHDDEPAGEGDVTLDGSASRSRGFEWGDATNGASGSPAGGDEPGDGTARAPESPAPDAGGSSIIEPPEPPDGDDGPSESSPILDREPMPEEHGDAEPDAPTEAADEGPAIVDPEPIQAEADTGLDESKEDAHDGPTTVDSEPSEEETPTTEGPDESPEPAGQDDPIQEDPVQDHSTPDHSTQDHSTQDEPTDPADARSILRGLLEELPDAELTDEEQALLRERLGLEAARSTDVRIGHLESRMERFSALVEAMEGFIDEHGSGTEFVTAVEEDVAGLAAEVDDLEERSEEASGERSAIREDVDAIDEQLAEVEARAAERIDVVESRFADRLQAIQATLEDREDAVSAVEERVAELESTLDEELAALAADVGERHRQIEERVAAIDDEVGRLRSDLESSVDEWDETAEGLERRLAGLDTDLEALKRAVSEEMDEVWAQVEEVERIRAALADAFETIAGEDDEPPGSMELPADTENGLS